MYAIYKLYHSKVVIKEYVILMISTFFFFFSEIDSQKYYCRRVVVFSFVCRLESSGELSTITIKTILRSPQALLQDFWFHWTEMGPKH